MITATYDAVAGELFIYIGDGKPALAIPAAELEVRFYVSGGIVSCLLGVDVADVDFLVVEEDPGRLCLDHIGAGRWRVRFEYVNPEDPGP